MSEALPAFQFYRETNFKEVELNGRKGRIPEEWEVVELGKVVHFESGKRPKGGGQEAGEVPSIGGEHIGSDGRIKWENMKFIPKAFFAQLKKGKVKVGDILLVKDGATTGKVAFVEDLKSYSEATINEHVYLLRPKDSDAVYNLFLFYFMYSPFAQVQIQQAFHGMIGGIKNSELKRLLLFLPPLAEQKRIAEVLRSIDEAIQAVEESIEKLERLKKGAMEQLLTKGIGHTKFKTVELNGRRLEIPEEWEVVELGNPEYFEIVMGQSPPSSSYNQEGKGMPFIQGAAEFGHIYVNPRMFTTKPLKIAKEGDIIISVRAPVGEVNIAPFELCIGRGVGAIRPNQAKVDTFFMYYRMSTVKNDLERLGGGAVFRAITKNTLKNFQIPLPPLQEQKQIAEILRTIDEAIGVKKQKKEKLERMKKAVMEKLLTGEVRVR